VTTEYAYFLEGRSPLTRRYYLTITTDSLTRQIKRLASHESFPCTLPALQDLIDVPDDWTAYIDLQIPAEDGLRSFFESILLMDRHSTGMVEWALAPSHTPTATRWAVLSATWSPASSCGRNRGRSFDENYYARYCRRVRSRRY
jgi:hypothetical protein